MGSGYCSTCKASFRDAARHYRSKGHLARVRRLEERRNHLTLREVS